MYVETFDGGSRYVRLESEDWDKIEGKRIVGEGEITGLTNAEGENHPAVIRTDEGALFTPTELDFVEFDGRHGFVDWDAWEVLKESEQCEEDDAGERLVADGGEDPTRHVDDETIEDAIESNYDEYNPDWLTVDEARDLLAAIQRSWEAVWDIHMDALENGDLELVAANGNLLVFADHNGTMWGDEFTHGELEDRDLDRAAKRTIKQIHHAVAKQYTDYPWETSDPFVIRKPDSFDAGQRFVEAFVNGLRRQGLSPGRAWAVYGVHVAGHSRNQWATMNGYSDHSAVSEALRKVEEKEPYIPVMHS